MRPTSNRSRSRWSKIIAAERPSALLPTLGGQTALNLSMELHKAGILQKYGVEMIGAKPEAITKGEDREIFKQCMIKIGLDVAKSRTVKSMPEAREAAEFRGLSADHPPLVYARWLGRWDRLQQGRIRTYLCQRSRPLARPRGARRRMSPRLEGIRDGGHARPQGSVCGHLLDREF